MENLFDDDSPSYDNHVSSEEGIMFNPVPAEYRHQPETITTEENVSEDEGIDLYSQWAMLNVAESNHSLLLPTILPDGTQSQRESGTPAEFFSTPGIHFVHIQMPNAMPHLDKERTLQECDTGMKNERSAQHTLSSSQIALAEGPDDPPIYQTSKVSSLPSGRLGKIRIHKSGKIKLHVGNHVFNFAPGNKVSCKQQVGCLMEENNEFLFLGNYRRKFVVSPDFSEMLQHH